MLGTPLTARPLTSLALPILAAALVSACGGSTFGSDRSGQNDAGSTGGSVGTGGASTGGSGGSATGGSGGTSQGGSTSGTGGSSQGGASTVLLASNFDQACTYDSQCALVAQGDQCTCQGTCSNAAVAQTALPSWTTAKAGIVCSGGIPACGLLCMDMLAICSSGTCAAHSPTIIDQNHYDRSCTSDSDCHVIFTGEVCSACRCSAGAVNNSGYDQYLQDVAAVDCNPGPNMCLCPVIGTAQCALPADGGPGTCTIG